MKKNQILLSLFTVQLLGFVSWILMRNSLQTQFVHSEVVFFPPFFGNMTQATVFVNKRLKKLLWMMSRQLEWCLSPEYCQQVDTWVLMINDSQTNNSGINFSHKLRTDQPIRELNDTKWYQWKELTHFIIKVTLISLAINILKEAFLNANTTSCDSN